MTNKPKILVVDEHDTPIGEAPKEEVWQKGLFHRIVRIMLEDEQGRILLQRRSMQVESFPGYWDHSAAGHVDAGEDYDEAARRELQEELGVTDVTLHKVAIYRADTLFNGRPLHRFNALYKATINSAQPLKLQKSEVGEARWFTLDEIKQFISKQSDKVTDGLAQVIANYYNDNHNQAS